MAARKFVLRAVCVVALAAFVITGLSRISFNVDVLKLLPTRLGTVTGLSLFARHFARPTELLVTVNAPDADAAERAVTVLAERFRSQPNLVARVVAQSPWEARPEQLSEFVAYLLMNQPPDKFAELLSRLSPEKIGATLQETKDTLADSFAPSDIGVASYDPLGLLRSLDLNRFASSSNLSEFSSKDGAFRVLYLEAPRAMPDYRVAIGWMKSIRATVDAAPLPSGVKVGLTGEPAFMAEISQQMQWDMKSSGATTLVIIAIIFWSCYRRVRPLALLIGMLVATFVVSLGTAGWMLNELSVIGVGFASIMIGLSVDYGYLIYQASLENRDSTSLRRAAFPSVLWAATTTSAAFFTLNASSMPGLNHLGNLVGLGVLIGGVLMLSIFVPLISKPQARPPEAPRLETWLAKPATRRGGTVLALGIVVVTIGTLLVRGLPGFDTSARVLKMRHSNANDVLEQLYGKLTDERDLISFVVTGRNETELLARLRTLDPKLKEAERTGLLLRALSPLLICPDAISQRTNLTAAHGILNERERLTAAVSKAGFHDDAFVLTKAILDQWRTWETAGLFPIWPRNETSAWILRRTIGHEPNGLVAMGLLQPAPGAEEKLLNLQTAGIHLVSWPLLGRELRRVIPREFALIIVSLLSVLLLLLAVAFRSLRDVLLMVATMTLVFLSLMGAMRLLGMQWNVFNVASIMLLLGTGTDYSIYTILALNRNGGDVARMQSKTGLVIFLCSGSAVAGFGTVGRASHLGLASLAQVCTLGLAIDAIITVFLLPLAWRWWKNWQEQKKRPAS